jgi:hypothetical protein
VQDDDVLDTGTVRAFVGDIRLAMARSTARPATCAAIRPRLAQLTDDAWLASELRAPHLASGVVGQYCVTHEAFARRNSQPELVATRALAAGDFHALIPPREDAVVTGEAHAVRSGYANLDCS